MVKNAIKIYGRIKPVMKRKDAGHYYIQEGNKEDTLFLQVREKDNHDDHKTELNHFRFYKVFDQHIRQHEIFTTVAKPIVDSALQGYNGTVFAYGQTGSGKTFTITGGPDDFEDRGLIPRAIEYVFRKISTAEGCLYTVCVTYLQIYNEAAYDLLGQHPRMARLEDLPRLNLLDDTEGYLHIRNLSLHPVGSEHEALNLLFLGDTNRAIAETPMNQASSRSHCMFTVHLAIRKTTWKSARRAKLHFVDLAGSERVHKKGENMDGRRLNEARHINLSLHYLEQVITALAESKRTHVPYRNCVITTMLRDSIGGNCLTSMVATLSLDSTHLPETLATCRFAQRVALVKNEATLNEDRDPMQEVSVLKSEVKRLKEQIRMLTEDRHKLEGPLTHEEEQECKVMVTGFLADSGNLELPLDLRKIEFCCHLLKKAVEEARRNKNGADEGARGRRAAFHVEKCMEELLQQRNDEIAILTELLRKEKRKRSKTAGLGCSRSLSPPMQRTAFDDYHKMARHAGLTLSKHDQLALRKYVSNPCHAAELNNLRMQLKNRHHAAKKIHDKIEESKARIVESRKTIGQTQLEMPTSPSIIRKHNEAKKALEEEQAKYRKNLGILRDLKNECDHLTRSIKQAEVRFIHNFKNWVANNGDFADASEDGNQEIPQKLEASSQGNGMEEANYVTTKSVQEEHGVNVRSLTPPQSAKYRPNSGQTNLEVDGGYDSAMTSTASSTARSNAGTDLLASPITACSKAEDCASSTKSSSFLRDFEEFTCRSETDNREDSNMNQSTPRDIFATDYELLKSQSLDVDKSEYSISLSQFLKENGLSEYLDCQAESDKDISDCKEANSTDDIHSLIQSMLDGKLDESVSTHLSRSHEYISAEFSLDKTDHMSQHLEGGIVQWSSRSHSPHMTSTTDVFDKEVSSLLTPNKLSQMKNYDSYNAILKQSDVSTNNLYSEEMMDELKDFIAGNKQELDLSNTASDKYDVGPNTPNFMGSDTNQIFNERNFVEKILSNLMQTPEQGDNLPLQSLMQAQRPLSSLNKKPWSPLTPKQANSRQDGEEAMEAISASKQTRNEEERISHKDLLPNEKEHSHGSSSLTPASMNTIFNQSNSDSKIISPTEPIPLDSPSQVNPNCKGQKNINRQTKARSFHSINTKQPTALSDFRDISLKNENMRPPSQSKGSWVNNAMDWDIGDNDRKKRGSHETECNSKTSEEMAEKKIGNSNEDGDNLSQLLFSNITLTGDPEVDEEIIEFYKAKQQALMGQKTMII